MFKFIKRLVGLAGSFRTVKQARAARKLEAKRHKKQGTYSHGPAYVWGKLGLSMVSERIKKEYGHILSRKARKKIAKNNGVRATRFYNGPSAQPQYNRNIGRSKYDGKGRVI